MNAATESQGAAGNTSTFTVSVMQAGSPPAKDATVDSPALKAGIEALFWVTARVTLAVVFFGFAYVFEGPLKNLLTAKHWTEITNEEIDKLKKEYQTYSELEVGVIKARNAILDSGQAIARPNSGRNKPNKGGKVMLIASRSALSALQSKFGGRTVVLNDALELAVPIFLERFANALDLQEEALAEQGFDTARLLAQNMLIEKDATELQDRIREEIARLQGYGRRGRSDS